MGTFSNITKALGGLHKAHNVGPIGKLHNKTEKKLFGKSSSSSKSKSKSKSGKSSKDKGGGEEGGGDFNRSVLEEGRDAIQLMKEAYPEIYGIRNEWDPKFAELEARTGEARSVAETGAVNRQGANIRKALRDANPGLAKADDAIQNELTNMGPSEIESELTSTALADLKLGGELSADEIRNNQQGSRAAWSARGLPGSNSAMVDEVMSRTTASDARKSQRMATAAAVDAQNTTRKAGDRAFGINAFNTEGSYFDPYQRIYGTGGSAVTGQVNGPTAFQPFLSSANSVGEGNQQANVSMALGGMEDSRARDLAQMEMDAQFKNAQLNRESNASIAAGNNKAAGNSAAWQAGGAALGIIAALLI